MTNIENVLRNFKNKNYIEALEELDKILIIEPSSVETQKYETPKSDATVDYGSPLVQTQ